MKKWLPVLLLLAVACSTERKIDKEKYRDLYRAGVDLIGFEPDDYFIGGISRGFTDSARKLKAEHEAIGNGTTRAEKAMRNLYAWASHDMEMGYLKYEGWILGGRENDQQFNEARNLLLTAIKEVKKAGNLYNDEKISDGQLQTIEREISDREAALSKGLSDPGSELNRESERGK